MGGNALNHAFTRRYQKEEYFALWSEINLRLKECFPNTQYGLVKSVEAKTSFGDMDILIEKSSAPENWREDVIRLLQPTEVFGTVRGADPNDPYIIIPGLIVHNQANSPTLSLDFKECQIDFIETPEFGCSMGYYSYNDAGNLMGRVAFSQGMRLTHYGLVLPVMASTRAPEEAYMPVLTGTRSLGEVVASNNFYEAIDFLGFDAEHHRRGFKTLEEMFGYIVANPRFDPWYFSLANRNSTDRIRDKKRPTYNAFLKWVDENKITAGPDAEKLWTGNEGKKIEVAALCGSKFRQACLERFPNVAQLIQEKVEADQHKRIAKTKFNGNLVNEWTGLTEIQLGAAMDLFRDTFQDEANMVRWIATSTPAEIHKRFMESQKPAPAADLSGPGPG